MDRKGIEAAEWRRRIWDSGYLSCRAIMGWTASSALWESTYQVMDKMPATPALVVVHISKSCRHPIDWFWISLCHFPGDKILANFRSGFKLNRSSWKMLFSILKQSWVLVGPGKFAILTRIQWNGNFPSTWKSHVVPNSGDVFFGSWAMLL